MRYRMKPVEVDAMRYPGHHHETVDVLIAFEDWFQGHGGIGRYKGQHLYINPRESVEIADPGDWIIRMENTFRVCKHDVFDASYERVPE
jgi:hypothetical protein